MTVKYPQVSVKLVGEDGNAFSIIARVTSALRSAGVSKEERDLFQAEAMKGDYNQLLGVVMDWVNCDEEDEEDEDTEDEFDDEDEDFYEDDEDEDWLDEEESDEDE